ncbi:MAG: hypothetical protein N3D11_12540 [Candidatus Sumerlaeia bacterium]|nr:hypothetical protein [Candidatus Sumerlaeia bacterium]
MQNQSLTVCRRLCMVLLLGFATVPDAPCAAVSSAATTSPRPVASPPPSRSATAPSAPRPASGVAALPAGITGVLVTVASTSAWYEAGLRTGDLIVGGNDRPVANDADFYKIFAATTHTAQIAADVWRGGERLRITVPSVLSPEVSVSSYGWDWARYVKYYAKGTTPSATLHQAYVAFETQRFPEAQAVFTSFAAAGKADPLTLVKLAWLHLRRRDKAEAETARKYLEQAKAMFDPTEGDVETQAKLEGSFMIYYQVVGSFQQAGIHGRRAITLAPQLVSNRLNYYFMLTEARSYVEAAPVADRLAADFPRSIYFQRLKRTANLQINNMAGVVEAGEALVALMPDDVATRLQLLPALDRINDNFNIRMHCNYLLQKKSKDLDNMQRAQALHFLALVEYRQRAFGKAEAAARQALALRNNAEDYLLLGNILHARRKWKDAVVAYCSVPGKTWGVTSQDLAQQTRKNDRLDDAISHLWSWQIKSLPTNIRMVVQARKQWMEERAVLKHSYIMRNRYAVRNAIIVVGAVLILTGLILKMASD